MPDKKLVGTRVKPERHERWENLVEESNEVNSMSQALRVAFERTFSDSGGSSGIETEKIIERIDKLEVEVEENREQIERIPYNYPALEEIAEEVVYRLAEEGRKKQEEERY